MAYKSATRIDSTELQGSSLVSKLLSLQSCRETNHKAPWMTQSLICLRISDRGWQHFLHKEYIDINECMGYIAVSYSWDPTSGLESDATGSYTITYPRYRSSRPSRVRDVVLDRIIKYADAMGLDLFWIDQECIGQEESDVKEQAMNSMDLVYSRSACPLGLLAVTLETQKQIDTLRSLMAGTFLISDQNSYPKLRGPPCEAYIDDVLRLLESVLRDRWWSRAWIFQEEYLSSTRMHLLIRCQPNLSIPHEFGRIPGEVCLKASEFREGTTRFLLAVKKISARTRRRRCARLLKVFGKYNVQYLFQTDFQHRAMSSRILADIDRRGITVPFDLLPVAANTCNYANRLCKKKIMRLGYSVGLCALAMCLLNGELIRNCDLIRKRPDQMSLGQYLQYSLFNRFDPPVLSKELYYLKSCRFRKVFLSRKGIHTKGHLWTVADRMDTHSWPEPPKRSRKRNTFGLNKLQRDYLLQLLDFLRGVPQSRDLAYYLWLYLDEDLETGSRTSPAKAHKDAMASAIVRAIEQKKTLCLVQTSGSHGISGILTGMRGMHSQAFTSWYDGVDVDGRRRHSRVSIEVEVTRKTPPLLKTLKWINGLVFFNNDCLTEVVFRWPKVWTRTTKRLPGKVYPGGSDRQQLRV